MTPREIIQAEYGDSRNFMTPRRLGIGALLDGAYELSMGTGLDHTPIWGVSVVRLSAGGETWRDTDACQVFHSRIKAQAYIRALKAGRA